MISIPKGFHFGAAQAAFKKEGRHDLGLIVSEKNAAAGAIFTTNLFKAAPVVQCMNQLKDRPYAKAILANSGQANACTGDEGMAHCRQTLVMAAKVAGVAPAEILPASTGVIGAQLRMDKWQAAMPQLGQSLGRTRPEVFARAIMTTDSFPKISSRSVEIDGDDVSILGMAKGAGMIAPNMATMLAFVCCDAQVEPDAWQAMVARCGGKSFNRVTVDGDTSTNDCLICLANGASGVFAESEEALGKLEAALLEVCRDLAFMIVQDAEGGTRVARIVTEGAEDDHEAGLVARAVGNSPLVKTALFGRDPNWGRIVAAAGRSGAIFDPDALVLEIGGITVFRDGTPAAGDIDALLAPVMNKSEVPIRIILGDGPGMAELFASDLTREYVTINADYRT